MCTAKGFVAVVTVLVLSTEITDAQGPAHDSQRRVRLTGAARTLPSTDMPTGPSLVVLKPRQRVVARVVQVTDRIVVIRVRDRNDTLTLPLETIGVFEVSAGRSGIRPVRGVLLGLAAFVAGLAVVYGMCNVSCGDGDQVWALPASAGITTGLVAGWRRESWRKVSRSEFISEAGGQPDNVRP